MLRDDQTQQLGPLGEQPVLNRGLDPTVQSRPRRRHRKTVRADAQRQQFRELTLLEEGVAVGAVKAEPHECDAERTGPPWVQRVLEPGLLGEGGPVAGEVDLP
jgi:hypothetical protein